MTGIITNPPHPPNFILYPPAPGCNGSHLLSPQQERSPNPGTSGLFHSGPAEGYEEDHLHCPVTSSQTSTTTNLNSHKPAPPSHFVQWDGLCWWIQERLTPNRKTETTPPLFLHLNRLFRLDIRPLQQCWAVPKTRPVFASDNQRRPCARLGKTSTVFIYFR